MAFENTVQNSESTSHFSRISAMMNFRKLLMRMSPLELTKGARVPSTRDGIYERCKQGTSIAVSPVVESTNTTKGLGFYVRPKSTCI